jgi:hypothetical protein
MSGGSAFGWALFFGLIGASFAHYGPRFLAWTDRRKQGIPSPDDDAWLRLLDAVNAAREDMDRLDELDLMADDYCEWLELRHQWMGSDQ